MGWSLTKTAVGPWMSTLTLRSRELRLIAPSPAKYHSHTDTPFFFWVAQQPLLGQSLFIVGASKSHSDTPQSVGLLWTSVQPDATADNTQLWKETDIHPTGGIRTRNPSKRVAADPPVRPHGHYYRDTQLPNETVLFLPNTRMVNFTSVTIRCFSHVWKWVTLLIQSLWCNVHSTNRLTWAEPQCRRFKGNIS